MVVAADEANAYIDVVRMARRWPVHFTPNGPDSSGDGDCDTNNGNDQDRLSVHRVSPESSLKPAN